MDKTTCEGCNRLQDVCDANTKTIEDLIQRCDNQATEIRLKGIELKDYENKVSMLQYEIQQMEEFIHEVDIHVKKLLEELDEKNVTIERLKKVESEHRAKILGLQDEIDTHKELLSNKEHTETLQKADIEKLTEQLESAQHQNEEQKRMIHNLRLLLITHETTNAIGRSVSLGYGFNTNANTTNINSPSSDSGVHKNRLISEPGNTNAASIPPDNDSLPRWSCYT